MGAFENFQSAYDRLLAALAAQPDSEETITITFTTTEGAAVCTALKQALESCPATPETSIEEAAANLTAILQEKSKHWAFREKKAKTTCAEAFVELLRLHSEEDIANAIDYAAAHPQYGSGLRLISSRKQQPWDWFIERYDEIQAHIANDADFMNRVAARAKKMAIGKPKVVDGKDLPRYRQDSGKRDILGKGDI